MDFNGFEQLLPKIYKKCERNCYLDPIRKRLTYVTSEETVRQKIIAYLINQLNIPLEMISSEKPLSHYREGLSGRADIIIHKIENDFKVPLAVVECKAPHVFIGDSEFKQVINYADNLLCDYVMISNLERTFCYHFNSVLNRYEEIEVLPNYTDMLGDEFSLIPKTQCPERIPFNEIEKYIIESRNNNFSTDIGESTDLNKAVVALNLWECYLETRNNELIIDSKLFSIVEDLGIRLLSYGNASGGVFSGPYRSWLIESNGENHIVSIGISSYYTYAKPDIIKTALNIAIDNDRAAHHALQYVFDDNTVIENNLMTFTHSGKIAIGNKGSGKISELKTLISKFHPEIIVDDEIVLGRLNTNILLTLDNPEVVKLTNNLIAYALVRDLYRDIIKNNKNKP